MYLHLLSFLRRPHLLSVLFLGISLALLGNVECLPLTSFGVLIANTQGVALSADGSRCFVIAREPPAFGSVYVIPFPFNTSLETVQPSAYWTTASTVDFQYIAASVTTSPQQLYLLDYGDEANVRLVSLNITSPPPANLSLLYSFGDPGQGLGVTGMFYQSASHLLYFSCQAGVSGAIFDFVGTIDPTIPFPTLQTFYVSSFQVAMTALAVSSTRLYFATVGLAISHVWAAPLISSNATSLIPNSTQTQLLYTTVIGNTTAATAVYPAGFVLNSNESILYIADWGDDNVEPNIPQAIYSLYPLYSAVTPLTLGTVYVEDNTQVQSSFAVSSDQSQLYFAAVGNRNGIYVTSNPNSSTAVPSSVTVSSTSSSLGSSASLSSVPFSPTGTSFVSATVASPTSAPTSSGTAMNGNSPIIPVGTIMHLTSFIFSDEVDDISCLAADSAVTVGFAASLGGEIFTWSWQALPVTVSPVWVSPISPVTGYPASFIACQANPEGTELYLLDRFGRLLYRYTIATPAVAPVVISSFPDEKGTAYGMTALTVDFTAQVAYVGTFLSSNLYTVNISITGQSLSAYYAYPMNSGLSSLALSPDGLTLYYGAAGTYAGSSGSINSLQVQAGYIPYPNLPTVLYDSTTLGWPDSLLFNGSTLIFKDGGPEVGLAPNFEFPAQLYSLALGSNSITKYYSTTTTLLLSGLVMAADYTRFYFNTGSTLNSVQLVAQPVATASLCLLFYSLPGNIDYPWSTATQLQVTYLPTPLTTSVGPAVALLSANGTRTFTNRFGTSFSTSLTVTLPSAGTVTPLRLIYLNSTTPFDSTGVTWNLSSAVQLPGNGPKPTTSLINVYNAGGILVEGSSTRVDGNGQAWLSSIPGFVNVTISASNINALAANYAACQAPISFTNGLRPPTQPSSSNGAVRFHYSYSVSDGVSYAVQINLTITTASAFATLNDQLGNPYQQVVNVNGTRLYTYLRTNATVLSRISGLNTSLSTITDQRFYPYALLSSAPGVYSLDTAPFLDVDGLEFNVSPAVPVNGAAPGIAPLYTAARVYFSTPEPTAVLIEAPNTNAPLVSFQQQSNQLD